jgi:EmrB/QacA subfamily drug resistance transporter
LSLASNRQTSLKEPARVRESPGVASADQAAGGLFFRIFPSLMLPMFLGVVDQTIVATALPAIAGSLGDVERISWVVVAYLITNTIAAPVYGRLGDALGRKRMMLIALVVMIGASAFCAAATSILMLTFARVLQGLGGGGLMTMSQALVGEAVPPRERARYQGYLAGVVVCSNSFGPIAGGYLTEAFGWRSIFLINVPLGLAAMAMVLRLPRRPPTGEGSRFDFKGLTYFIFFVVPTLLALEQINRFSLATVPYFAAFAAVSVASLILLLRNEARTKHPLLPITLLRQPVIWRSDALAAFHGAALVSLITFVPVYLRVVRGTTASETGFLLLPIAIGIFIGSLTTGRLVSKTGRTTIFPALALIPVVILLVLLALQLDRLSLTQLAVLLGAVAFLMGSVMVVVQVLVQHAAGLSMLGSAAGSVQFSRAIGAAFGTALVATLLFATLSTVDPQASGYFGELMARGPAALEHLGSAAQLAVTAALATAFRLSFMLIAVYVTLGTVLAWSIPLKRLT